MTDYLVRTDVYNGPLDLLLFLIRRDEIDIYDIPIARVTEQYLHYIEMLHSIDPNVAGEFLVMAAMLMEIKSRMLLPRAPAGDDATDDLDDPRLELVRQLLQYKTYKDASFALSAAADIQASRWPRQPARTPVKPPGEVDLEDAQIWDLVAAFTRMMASIGAGPVTHDVVFDDTPLALHAVDVIDRLQAEGGELAFEKIFKGRTKSEMIGLFLALLELIRQQRVRVVQPVLFGEIVVQLLSAEPIEIGDEWEPGLASHVAGEEIEITPDVSETDVKSASTSDAHAPEPDGDASDDDSDVDVETESFAELDEIRTEIDFDRLGGGAAVQGDEAANEEAME